MEQIHLNRLTRMAEHLEKDEINKKYSGVEHLKFGADKQLFFQNNKYYMIFPWFEEELDIVFPADFTRNRKNNLVVYIKQPLTTITFALPEFYNLSTTMFLHCFSVGRQLPEYGRFRMDCKSNPKHCSRIIHQFLKNYQLQKRVQQKTLIRKVIFEKVRNNSPEKLTKEFKNEF